MRLAPLLATLAALALGAGLVALARWGLSPDAQAAIGRAALAAMLAVSLSLTNGLAGLRSFGHPAFMLIGGYAAAILTYPPDLKTAALPGLPEWLATAEWGLFAALLAAGVTAMALAAILGYPALRRGPGRLAWVTLAMIVIVPALIERAASRTGGAAGLDAVPPLADLWWIYGAAALAFLLCWRVKHSSLGRSLRAVRDDETAARAAGLSPRRTRLLAFMAGAFFAGAAGALWAHQAGAIAPSSFGLMLAFYLLAMVVIGGSGSLAGAALAAILIVGLREGLRPVEEAAGVYGLTPFLIALALLAILILRPQGLFGENEPRPLSGSSHPPPSPPAGR